MANTYGGQGFGNKYEDPYAFDMTSINQPMQSKGDPYAFDISKPLKGGKKAGK